MPLLRFAVFLFAASVVVLCRRLRARPRSPLWTFKQEVIVDAMRRSGRLMMRSSSSAARAHLTALTRPSAAARLVRWEPTDLDGLAGVWVRPKSAPEGRVLLYFHGGGYVFGSVETYRDLLARLALAAGVVVLAIDYRRAPEHPFPAAVDDCLRSYRWLRARGVAASQIVVGGDSSGGALALSTMFGVRDATEALPAGALLLSPWVDLTAASGSVASNSGLDWGDRAYLLRFAGQYLAGADALDPRASPLRADLRGLPRMLVQVGGVELLRDEVTALAQAAREAGVRVDLRVFEAAVHGVAMMPEVFLEGQQAVMEAGSFVREVLGVSCGD